MRQCTLSPAATALPELPAGAVAAMAAAEKASAAAAQASWKPLEDVNMRSSLTWECAVQTLQGGWRKGLFPRANLRHPSRKNLPLLTKKIRTGNRRSRVTAEARR